MKRIQQGDLVIVTTGSSKGHTGNVLSVDGLRVKVAGANMKTKCIKPNPQTREKGGLVKKEAFIHVSNVALYNPATKKADKVGFKYLEAEGKKAGGKRRKVRYFKSNEEVVTQA